MGLPLSDIRVLDLSRLLPGPYCTWLLADMGADVIRVEQATEIAKQDKVFGHKKIDKNDREKIRAHEFMSRNKKSILVDLKKNQARQIVYKMAESCDIFLEDYRPGVMKSLGMGYDEIEKVNPMIIYCSISLCGQDGPYRDLAGHDPIALSLAGVLSHLGQAGDAPTLPGIPLADIVAGLHAAVGILISLKAREKTGAGQHVDISMTDCARGFLSMTYPRYFRSGFKPKRGWRQPHIGIWRTKDDKFVCTTDMEPRYWENFCKAIGREDLIPFQHDLDKREFVIETIERIFLSKDRDEWFRVLREAGSQVAPVYEIEESLNDPQAIYRGMLLEVDHPSLGKVRQPGIPIKLSGTPGSVRRTAPMPGEDTLQIMQWLGYTREEIDAFVKEGIIKPGLEEVRPKEGLSHLRGRST